MSEWNPDKYLEFKSERTQPSIDLVSKIGLSDPETILDVGCGPGNSSKILLNRWPQAQITGLDQSEEMIKAAAREYPDMKWIANDFHAQDFDNRFDLVFSNAAIQWIPDHEKLLKKFRSLTSDNGAIAVQIPQFWDMPLGKIIDRVSRDSRWMDRMKHVGDQFTFNDYSFFYNALSEMFVSVEMWETDYLHVLDSHGAIMQMMQSTGLKPYHESLDNDSAIQQFDEMVLNELVAAYPSQNDGKVILPFDRLFFVAYT